MVLSLISQQNFKFMWKAFLLAALIVACYSNLDIPGLKYKESLSQCERQLEFSRDSLVALCTGTYLDPSGQPFNRSMILRRDDMQSPFTIEQVFPFSTLYYYNYMTKDGKMVAVYQKNTTMHIFYQEKHCQPYRQINVIENVDQLSHISQNHQHLVIHDVKTKNVQYYRFDVLQKKFNYVQTIIKVSQFSCLRISDDRRAIIIMTKNSIEIVYKPKNSQQFLVKRIQKYNGYQSWSCGTSFDSLPDLYFSGITRQYNFIGKFNIESGKYQQITKFSLLDFNIPSSDGYSEISNGKWVSFIEGHKYSLGKIVDDKFMMVSSRNQWIDSGYNVWDTDLYYNPNTQKYYQTLVDWKNGAHVYEVLDNKCSQNDTECFQYDCSQDQGSTGIRLNNEECQCKHTHQYNSMSKLCLPTCQGPLDQGRNSDNQKECLCKEPSYWNKDSHSCHLPCQLIQGSTGQYNSKSNICQCKPGYKWKKKKLSCKIDVKLQFLQQICPDGLIWNLNQEKCIIDCDDIEGAVGLNVDKNGCECQDGNVWNAQESLCTQA